MYIKLSNATDTGVGFITHDDWLSLSFNRRGNIVQVTGNQLPALAWAARVSGTVIDDAEAIAEIEAEEAAAIAAEIAQKEAEVTTLRSILTSKPEIGVTS